MLRLSSFVGRNSVHQALYVQKPVQFANKFSTQANVQFGATPNWNASNLVVIGI